ERADDFAYGGGAAAADFERGVDAAQADHVAAVAAAVQAADPGARDQAAAVDAHETVAELLLQRLQRLLDQVLATGVADYHVLLLGLQEVHVLQRDQPEAAAHARAQVPPAFPAPGAASGQEGAGARQRRGQPFRAHRLDQEIHRIDLEGRHRVAVVG